MRTRFLQLPSISGLKMHKEPPRSSVNRTEPGRVRSILLTLVTNPNHRPPVHTPTPQQLHASIQPHRHHQASITACLHTTTTTTTPPQLHASIQPHRHNQASITTCLHTTTTTTTPPQSHGAIQPHRHHQASITTRLHTTTTHLHNYT